MSELTDRLRGLQRAELSGSNRPPEFAGFVPPYSHEAADRIDEQDMVTNGLMLKIEQLEAIAADYKEALQHIQLLADSIDESRVTPDLVCSPVTMVFIKDVLREALEES